MRMHEQNTREAGFYWVRDGEQWLVAQWVHEERYGEAYRHWLYPGWEVPVLDRTVDEVDERPVVRDVHRT